MKISAVGVSSTNLDRTVSFYTLLGFEFPKYERDENHLEPITPDGSSRLMIDTAELVKSMTGENPRPGNTSNFAIEYDDPREVDTAAQKVHEAGFKVIKSPWDAFWGQRYAIVEDPDGFRLDLYAYL